jgi:hypothetical protein
MRVRALLFLTTMVLGVMLLSRVTPAATKAPGNYSLITGDKQKSQTRDATGKKLRA